MALLFAYICFVLSLHTVYMYYHGFVVCVNMICTEIIGITHVKFISCILLAALIQDGPATG
jgi:hypothetical protein